MKKIDLSPYRERFTDDCQELISFAYDQASGLKHPFLEPGHLLHALNRINSELVETTLNGLGVPFDTFCRETERWMQSIAPGDTEIVASDSTRKSFHLAQEHSQRSNRNHISVVDMILGVLRSEDAAVIRILESVNLSILLAVQGFQRQYRELERQHREHRQRYELPTYLNQFASNLNLKAFSGKLAPVLGRDSELRQMSEILSHRQRANSVMLIGEAGVGKTALAEGYAQLIEDKSELIPDYLTDRQIVQLQMNSLVAGTMFRGMFEDRIERILKEIREHPEYILFIDEAHTLVGAGSAVGVPTDAANIFKGALARGEIQVIGATTHTEYRRFIQEDEALARRFRTVRVDEPDLAETASILEGVTPHLESLYEVDLPLEVSQAALQLSTRYKRSLRRPDKVIGWLDTSCVRAEIAGRSAVAMDDLFSVVSDDAGIPEDFIRRQAEDRLRGLEIRMSERIVGQEDALSRVAARMRLNKGPLKENFDRPDGVFLFLGPTGVGKTEVARSLAFDLFGDANQMIRIDMSEFQMGSLGIDKLIGMPRGIVGSDMGGVLTNRIQEQPYSVVLLDEIEKADRSVLNLFLQVFDEGWCTDGRGKKVYFSDAIIIMTSNLGTQAIRSLANPPGFTQPATGDGHSQVKREVMKELENDLSPELLNRLDEVVVFTALSEAEIEEIAHRYIEGIEQRMHEHGKQLAVSEAALKWLAKDGYSLKYGARHLKRQIDKWVKLPLTTSWSQSDSFIVDLEEERLCVLPQDHLVTV